eukprot:Rhum_TRINITY_DN19326_c0_g1::Rhum_TRINITY_DN19326_c0_g1_i1::g.169806::m.169806
MLRRSGALCSLNARWDIATQLLTGGVPRVSQSPQAIVHDRKKQTYVQVDNMAIRRQAQVKSRAWKTMPILHDLVEQGDGLYQQELSNEYDVLQHRDSVLARRLLKQRRFRQERAKAFAAQE